MKYNEVINLCLSEIENWPGVQHVLDQGKRHHKLKLTYNGSSRTIPMPSTPSDHRAAKNQVMYIKRLLRDLGASRVQ